MDALLLALKNDKFSSVVGSHEVVLVATNVMAHLYTLKHTVLIDDCLDLCEEIVRNTGTLRSACMEMSKDSGNSVFVSLLSEFTDAALVASMDNISGVKARQVEERKNYGQIKHLLLLVDRIIQEQKHTTENARVVRERLRTARELVSKAMELARLLLISNEELDLKSIHTEILKSLNGISRKKESTKIPSAEMGNEEY